MKAFVQDGQTIAILAASLIASGSVVELTDMVAVAVGEIEAGDEGVGLVSGVITLPKETTDDIAQGQQVFVNGTGLITTTATSNTPVGKAWISAGNGVEEIDVKLNV